MYFFNWQCKILYLILNQTEQGIQRKMHHDQIRCAPEIQYGFDIFLKNQLILSTNTNRVKSLSFFWGGGGGVHLNTLKKHFIKIPSGGVHVTRNRGWTSQQPARNSSLRLTADTELSRVNSTWALKWIFHCLNFERNPWPLPTCCFQSCEREVSKGSS